ncbi:MAG: NfeD family protein [Verrucomicrobiae bacterium]|nr:NfeD family protein [Verrucomicrobiae bacterium]
MLATVIILALFGIIMLCLEVVLPGAIIGIVGGGLIIASVVLTFTDPEMQQYGTGIQSFLAVGIIITAIASLLWWMRYFQTTFIGRHLILRAKGGQDTPPEAFPDLKGKMGVAKSDLRPSGTVVIDGIRYEAQSPTGFISQGTGIKVSKCEGNSVAVIPVAATSDE